MVRIDTQKIGTDLRHALLALGIVADRLVVRSEAIPGQLWIRCMVQIGAQSIDVHSPAELWPPANNTARSILWVLRHGERAALYGTVDDWVAGFKRVASEPRNKTPKTTRANAQ